LSSPCPCPGPWGKVLVLVLVLGVRSLSLSLGVRSLLTSLPIQLSKDILAIIFWFQGILLLQEILYRPILGARLCSASCSRLTFISVMPPSRYLEEQYTHFPNEWVNCVIVVLLWYESSIGLQQGNRVQRDETNCSSLSSLYFQYGLASYK